MRKVLVILILAFFWALIPKNAIASVSTGPATNYVVDIKDIFTNNTKKPVTNINITENFRAAEDGTHSYAVLTKSNLYFKPTSVTTDEKGNQLATYKIPQLKPGESITIGQKLYFQGNTVNYKLNAQNVGSDYSGFSLYQTYMTPSYLIESDNLQIKQTAQKIVNQETNPYLKARKIYGFVNRYITYDDAEAYSNKGALNALNTARGVCYEYSALMVAMLRSVGVPARMVEGYKVESEDLNKAPRLPDGRINLNSFTHAWVEFYLPGTGWVPSEPTVKYTLNGKQQTSWDYFTNMNTPLYIPLSVDIKMESKWSSNGHLDIRREEALEVNPQDFSAPPTEPQLIPVEELVNQVKPTFDKINQQFNINTIINWLNNNLKIVIFALVVLVVIVIILI